MNFANALTFLRLIFIIPFAHYFSNQAYINTLIILTFMGATDLLDGHIARKFNQKTKLGAFLDPLTDKILIFTGSFILVYQSAIPLWFFTLVTAKDFSMLVGAILLKNKKVDWEPCPNLYGKVAVSLQVLIIFEGIFHKAFYNLKYPILISSIICSIFTLISLFYYISYFLNRINSKRSSNNAC